MTPAFSNIWISYPDSFYSTLLINVDCKLSSFRSSEGLHVGKMVDPNRKFLVVVSHLFPLLLFLFLQLLVNLTRDRSLMVFFPAHCTFCFVLSYLLSSPFPLPALCSRELCFSLCIPGNLGTLFVCYFSGYVTKVPNICFLERASYYIFISSATFLD